MSRSGYHDRRGYDFYLKFCLSMAVVGLLVLIFYSWKVGFLILLFFCHQFITNENVSAPPPNEPRAFLNWSRYQEKRRPVLLCVGDSLTHGTISANITTEIPMKVADILGMERPVYGHVFNDPIWVINAGQNALTSHVILHERLSKAMGTFPDYIVLWIGTNDVLSLHNKFLQKYIAGINGLAEKDQTLACFESNINAIIKFIRESSPKVELGVCTLPPIGEDLNSSVNQLVKEANSMIELAVSNAEERTSIIPVFAQLESIIEKKRRSKNSLSIDYSLMFSSVMYPMHVWFSRLGLSWNSLSMLLGHVVMTDGLHLNETGRDIVVDLIVEWLKVRNITKVMALKSL